MWMSGANSRHNTSAVTAGISGIPGICSKDVQHISEIETHRSHVKLHLVIGKLHVFSLRERHNFEIADCATRVKMSSNRSSKRHRCFGKTWNFSLLANLEHLLGLMFVDGARSHRAAQGELPGEEGAAPGAQASGGGELE